MLSMLLGALLLLAIGYGLGRYRSGLATNEGEALVRKVLRTEFSSLEFHLLNNVTLPTPKGSTQIDHILVSTRGIFVIETKHYSGWIFGSPTSPKWTQVIYRVRSSFQNPIRQNYGHLKAVQKLLDFQSKEDIHSAVVFTGPAKFKSQKPNGVYYLKELLQFIQSQPDGKLSQNRMQFCVGRLECQRYSLSKQTDIEHVSHLIKRFGD